MLTKATNWLILTHFSYSAYLGSVNALLHALKPIRIMKSVSKLAQYILTILAMPIVIIIGILVLAFCATRDVVFGVAD